MQNPESDAKLARLGKLDAEVEVVVDEDARRFASAYRQHPFLLKSVMVRLGSRCWKVSTGTGRN